MRVAISNWQDFIRFNHRLLLSLDFCFGLLSYGRIAFAIAYANALFLFDHAASFQIHACETYQV